MHTYTQSKKLFSDFPFGKSMGLPSMWGDLVWSCLILKILSISEGTGMVSEETWITFLLVLDLNMPKLFYHF